MAEDKKHREPKISLTEAFLIGFGLLVLDIIDLIPFAGDFTDIAAAPLALYYWFKGINGAVYILALIADAIPVLQEFPFRSVVWIATVILDRYAPAKVAEVVEKTGELAEGKTGEGGGAGALSEGVEGGGAARDTAWGAKLEPIIEGASDAEGAYELGRAIKGEKGEEDEGGAEGGEGGKKHGGEEGGEEEGEGEGSETSSKEEEERKLQRALGEPETTEEEAQRTQFEEPVVMPKRNKTEGDNSLDKAA